MYQFGVMFSERYNLLPSPFRTNFRITILRVILHSVTLIERETESYSTLLSVSLFSPFKPPTCLLRTTSKCGRGLGTRTSTPVRSTERPIVVKKERLRRNIHIRIYTYTLRTHTTHHLHTQDTHTYILQTHF